MGCIEGSNSHFLRYNVEILNVLTFGFHLIGATALEPSWAEAWVTLGRAQLNFGEPDSAIESFDKASAIKVHSYPRTRDHTVSGFGPRTCIW
uniref:Uncharacterized protein n=1 Tax=Rhizophora mucronata TaxID=61149 RepID=A0A2P2LF51_RHIMU